MLTLSSKLVSRLVYRCIRLDYIELGTIVFIWRYSCMVFWLLFFMRAELAVDLSAIGAGLNPVSSISRTSWALSYLHDKNGDVLVDV